MRSISIVPRCCISNPRPSAVLIGPLPWLNIIMVALMQSIRNNESAEGTGSDTKIQIFFFYQTFNIQVAQIHTECRVSGIIKMVLFQLWLKISLKGVCSSMVIHLFTDSVSSVYGNMNGGPCMIPFTACIELCHLNIWCGVPQGSVHGPVVFL